MARAPFTPRVRAFITAYLADPKHNGKKAAISAGFSPKTAESQASRLLSNAKVSAELARRLASIEEKAEITVVEVLRELKKIGFADIRKAYGPDNKLLPVAQLPDDLAAAVMSVESEELFEGVGQDRERVGDTVKLKFADKVRALENLGRHLKMFTDKVEHELAEGVFERLERAKQHLGKGRDERAA